MPEFLPHYVLFGKVPGPIAGYRETFSAEYFSPIPSVNPECRFIIDPYNRSFGLHSHRFLLPVRISLFINSYYKVQLRAIELFPQLGAPRLIEGQHYTANELRTFLANGGSLPGSTIQEINTRMGSWSLTSSSDHLVHSPLSQLSE